VIEGALTANRLATADVATAINHLGETKELAAMKTESGKRVATHLEELEQLPHRSAEWRIQARRRADTSLKRATKDSDRAWQILGKAKPEIISDPVQGRYPSMYPDGRLVNVLDGLTPPPAQ